MTEVLQSMEKDREAMSALMKTLIDLIYSFNRGQTNVIIIFNWMWFDREYSWSISIDWICGMLFNWAHGNTDWFEANRLNQEIWIYRIGIRHQILYQYKKKMFTNGSDVRQFEFKHALPPNEYTTHPLLSSLSFRFSSFYNLHTVNAIYTCSACM